MPQPILFEYSVVAERRKKMAESDTYIKPHVNVRNSTSMAGGLNVLRRISVPWDLTCDEIIFCHKGTFRLVCDDRKYVLKPGDMIFIPKGNHIAYETDEECEVFYAAWPVDWKQQAGLTHVPGIDPEDM